MKLFNITDARTFFERVLQCQGWIGSIERDGSERDLKQIAREMLASGMVKHIGVIRRIDLRVEEPADKGLLLNFAVQAQDRRAG